MVKPNTDQYSSGPEPLPLRAKPPQASIALNRKTILVVVIILSLLAGAALLQGLGKGPNLKTLVSPQAHSIQIDAAIRNLPKTYKDIPRIKPQLGPPLKGEIGSTEVAFRKSSDSVSDEEKLRSELRLQRMKQATLAHSSDITFGSARFESASQKVSLAGNNPSDDSTSYASLLQGPTASMRDEDNRQDDKQSFLKQNRNSNQELPSFLTSPFSPYQLTVGTILPGILLTGINSDLPGHIEGQISQNIFDTRLGKYLLLPQGSKIIGEYDSRITYGQDRVLVVWTRIILPNAKSINLEGMPGTDLSGYAGLHEKVNNHYGRLITGVILGSILGAGAQIARGSNRTIDPEFGQLALEGTAQNINQAGQQITRKNLNIQPTVEISPGQRFNVFVTKDLVLEPYRAT